MVKEQISQSKWGKRKKMKILNDYIRFRKAEAENNADEYTEVLDLITIDKKVLEDYTKYLKKRLTEQF